MKRLLGLLLSISPALAFAQAQPPEGQQAAAPGFRESVEVRVMDLDVSVNDSKGQPVGDLRKDEFVVTVDGQAVPIDYFTRIEEGTIHAPDLATASPDRVLEEYRKGPDAYVPRHYLFYFDLGNLSPASRKRGLEALRDLVTRFGPSDSARVVTFDRQATTLSEWTSSKETLFSALDKIDSSGVAMSRLIIEQQTLREIDATPRRGFGRGSSRQFLVRSYAEQQRAALEILLKDIHAELATLTPMPGKKSFIYVSGGFDMQPGYAMSQYANGISLASFDVRNMSGEVDAIVRRANASDVTFYTLDARGLTAEGVSASNDDPLLARPGTAFIARQDSQAGLIELARQTGGFAVLDTNNIQAGIARVYADTSSYYSIGVNISKLPVTRTGYRNVAVTVSRPSMTVRARRGYSPRTAADRGRDVAQATLRSNAEFRAIPVDLRIAPAKKAKKYYELPIMVSIPASSLTFLPEANGARATADIYIGAIDQRGFVSDIGHAQAVFTLRAGAKPETELKYTTKLEIRKGNMRIAVNVQDRETGKMGTAKADVKVE